MKTKSEPDDGVEMRDDYDFSNGVRGRLRDRLAHGANIVVIDPDLLDVFPDSESVNAALRPLAEIIRARTGR